MSEVQKKRLVIKLGSSTLTAGSDRISRGKIEDLAREILKLKDDYEIVLVSSGAIAAANQLINQHRWSKDVKSKQAKAAIGQPILLQIYNEVFRDFELRTAQCLLTYEDFSRETSRKNTFNTIDELLNHSYIPIVNENDTVSVSEILVGDNDKLSAYVASLINADKLILVSDVDGIYNKNPHIHADAKLIDRVSNVEEVLACIDEKESELGTGGMTTKLEAAQICLDNDIEMYILNGKETSFISKALRGDKKCTLFKK
jgi:glutamate 5-kinase